MSDTLKYIMDDKQSESFLTHGYLKREVFIIKPNSDPVAMPDESDPALDGRSGLYRIEFTLQPPSCSIPNDLKYETQPDLPGGSLLKIDNLLPEGQGHIEVKSAYRSDSNDSTVEIEYHFLPNTEGLLGTVKAALRANNFEDAEQKAWGSLSPIISEWAFAHDVPLDIARIRIEEVVTRICKTIHLNQLYKIVTCDPEYLGQFAIPKLYHPLIYYREALSSLSPFYQFLCYYKVTELLPGLHTAQEQQKYGIKKIEHNDWLKANLEDTNLYNQVVNKSISHVVQNILKVPRHRIAHAFLDRDPNPADRDAEKLLNYDEAYRLLPLVKYIAREMVLHEMRIDSEDYQ